MKRHVPNSRGRGKRTGYEMKTRPDRPRHCCGRKIRTSDLWVMSPTSYRCSIPHLDSTPRGRSRRAANEVIARRRRTRSEERRVGKECRAWWVAAPVDRDGGKVER